MNTLRDLIPVKMHNKIVVDKERFGKVTSIPYVESLDKSFSISGLPYQCMVYIRDAINNYYKVYKNTPVKEKDNPTIVCSFSLPGRPIERQDGKIISKNEDGTFCIAPNKEYLTRIKDIVSIRGEIVAGRSNLIPIEYPVEVECVFNIKKRGKSSSLPQLISSTLDLLVRLKILAKETYDMVPCVDGSKICYTKESEYTLVTIKRIIGGKDG